MKKIIFALIAGVTAMSAAQAQMISKPYVGIGAVATKHQMNLGGVNTTSSEGTQGNGKIFVGADVSPTMGLELGHSRGKSEHNYSIAAIPGTAETDTRRTYLAAKATMPMNEQVSLFGKLGATHVKTKLSSANPLLNGSESDNGVYAGLGAQYNFNEKVAMTLEYERYGKKKDVGAKPDAVSLNARYSF